MKHSKYTIKWVNTWYSPSRTENDPSAVDLNRIN